MTTDTVDKPIKKRTKKQQEWYDKLSRQKTKADPHKIAELLSSGKINKSDVAKLLNVTPQAIYNSIRENRIDTSGFDIPSIKDKEIDELYVLGSILRKRMYDKVVSDDKLGLIEMCAGIDRTFQQRRELQGKAHSSINVFTLVLQRADQQIISTSATTISSTPIPDNQPIVPDAGNHTTGCQDNVT